MIKSTHIILAIIFIIGIVLRFHGLDKTPPGLYIDEISIATNAYTISQNLKDEFGKFLPYWFKALGEYKLPGYIYTVSIFDFFLGNTYWSIRLPSAISGTLGIILMYGVTWQLFPKLSKKYNNLLPLSCALFWAIVPWSLLFSRAGFESNMATTLFLGGFYLLNSVLGNKTKKLPKYSLIRLICSGLLFSLSVATYNTFRVFVPLFFLWLVINFHKKIWSQSKIFSLSFFIVVVLSMPIILNQFSKDGLIRIKSENVFENKTFSQAVNSLGLAIVDNIDPNYLFFFGDQMGRHSVRNQGQLLYIQLPLILLGFFIIKKAKYLKQKNLLLAWFFIGIIPSVVSTPSPHALRSLVVLPVWIFLSGLGSYFLVDFFEKRIDRYILKKSIYGIFILLTIYNLAIYQTEYYTRYRLATALDWGDGNYEAVIYLKNKIDSFDEIYVSDQLPYHYVAYFLPLSPETIQSNTNHFSKNLPSFDKFSFFVNAGDIPITNTSKLIIAPWWNEPRINATNIYYVNLVNGDHLYNIWEEHAN